MRVVSFGDDQGVEVADTYHESVDRAMSQAEWEFNVSPDEWDVIQP